MWKPPHIIYDELEPAVLEADPPKPVEVVEVPKPLPLPGQLKPMPGKVTAAPEAKDPKERVAKANDAARVQPTRHGYLNAVQVYPFARYLGAQEYVRRAWKIERELNRLRRLRRCAGHLPTPSRGPARSHVRETHARADQREPDRAHAVASA